MSQQTVRIIGGKFRGKKLQFPAKTNLRPTPDRVKETVFNWLMHDIANARCLDAFAGSGALGFEAFSRGASRVVLVEIDLQIYTYLKKVAQSFNNTNLNVVHASFDTFMHSSSESFDIIFLDPPFVQQAIPYYLHALSFSHLLIANGLLYIESDRHIAPNPIHWAQLKSKQAGKVVYSLYQKI